MFLRSSPAALSRRASAVARALLALSLAASAAAALVALAERDRPSPSLSSSVAAIAEGHRVPADLLLAITYAETRGGRGGPPGARALARRLAQAPSRLLAEARGRASRGAVDEALSQRASPLSAAGLRAGLSAASPLPAWQGALVASWWGRDPLAARLHADGALRLLASGFSGRDASGSPFDAPPRPDLWGELAPLPSEPASFVGAPFALAWPAPEAAHRPPRVVPRAITHIVIHTTEGPFASTLEHLRREGAAVSAHYLVRSQDGLTGQMVDEREVAFHDACFNEHSVGVEHEGVVAEGARWYTDELYRASARLVRDVARRNHIPLDRQHILGHGEAPDCSDHTDPGPAWDWGRYMRYLQEAPEG